VLTVEIYRIHRRRAFEQIKTLKIDILRLFFADKKSNNYYFCV